MGFIKATCETQVEVVHLAPAVQLHLHLLVTIVHSGEGSRKFWRAEVLRVIITVILEMLRDLCLQENRKNSSMLPVD